MTDISEVAEAAEIPEGAALSATPFPPDEFPDPPQDPVDLGTGQDGQVH